jgi:CRISPR-associated protein Csm3
MSIKLEKKIFISGAIETKTGLAVGGSSTGLEIGGADKVVVRNPVNNQPYIPGSSLKGKMRSLLEKLEGNMRIEVKHKNNEEKWITQKVSDRVDEIPSEILAKKKDEIQITAMPCKCGECLICHIFGVPAEEKGMPARLIVRDCDLINPEVLERSKNTDMPYTEVKTEVVIDRITSAATPRQFERVPAGAVFGLNLICNIYEGDDEQKLLDKIFEGLRLVQDDYLGGSGTRGYGQMKFKIDSVKYKDQSCYENDKPSEDLADFAISQELQ